MHQEQPTFVSTVPPSEKRIEDRVQKMLFAVIHGSEVTHKALIVNLSVGGALFTILDGDFDVPPGERPDPIQALRAANHFGETVRVEFLEQDISLDADVVRFEVRDYEGCPRFHFGCKFRHALTEAQRISFGLMALEGDLAAAAVLGEMGETAGNGPRIVAEPGSGPVVVVKGSDASVRRAQREPALRSVPLGAGRAVTLQDVLREAVEKNASDVHFHAGSPVRMRVDGDLVKMGDHPLSDHEAESLLQHILTEEQFERFDETGDLDVAISLDGVARFRVNALRAQGECGMAIRRIPEIVPTLHDLGLPPICEQLAELPRGLVLITGPTGSGKSTSLAALLSHINRTRRCHILTMEDPIEFLHKEDQAFITQREVGSDTEDFASALKRALRQDPDVILVGEMRDLETISLAVTAAETGHLVFATLHTTSAVLTVDRIVDVFPPAQQRQIRMQLADCLQGVICQMLLPRIGGGRVVAQEILRVNAGVRALIREGKSPQIGNMMQTGAKSGMLTLEDSLNDLIAKRQIAYDTAVGKANNPASIERRGKRRNAPGL